MRRFVVAALVAPFLVVPFASAASAACGRVASDFNGDGYGDLAVSAPNAYEPIGQVNWQGVVHVAYGSAGGMGPKTTFTGRSSGLPRGQFGGSNRLGESMASGYFDGDCYADLAVSAASGSQALILYGTASGLTTARSAGFDRESIQPDGEYGTGFSYDLAAGDFNGDGFDDVAAGAPWTDDNSGAFGVLYGSSTGVTGTGSQWISQDSPGVSGAAEPSDLLGQVLAAGDFNGDGRADLAVGAPGEQLGSRDNAGGVLVFPGTAAGLGTVGSSWWDQDSPGVPGAAERWDGFGADLAAADANGDGRAELAVGVPEETIGAKASAGLVNLFQGTAAGLVAGPAFDQDNAAIPGAAEGGDYFGAAVAFVDLNRDGRRDLVVGAPGETVGSTQSTGAVAVLYSTPVGPAAAGAAYVDQNSAGVPGNNERGDAFGYSLGSLQNAYGGEAVVISAPDEKVSLPYEGAATILPGTTRGVSRTEGYFFSGAKFPGGASAESSFGVGLA